MVMAPKFKYFNPEDPSATVPIAGAEANSTNAFLSLPVIADKSGDMDKCKVALDKAKTEETSKKLLADQAWAKALEAQRVGMRSDRRLIGMKGETDRGTRGAASSKESARHCLFYQSLEFVRCSESLKVLRYCCAYCFKFDPSLSEHIHHSEESRGQSRHDGQRGRHQDCR